MPSHTYSSTRAAGAEIFELQCVTHRDHPIIAVQLIDFFANLSRLEVGGVIESAVLSINRFDLSTYGFSSGVSSGRFDGPVNQTPLPFCLLSLPNSHPKSPISEPPFCMPATVNTRAARSGEEFNRFELVFSRWDSRLGLRMSPLTALCKPEASQPISEALRAPRLAKPPPAGGVCRDRSRRSPQLCDRASRRRRGSPEASNGMSSQRFP